MQPATRHHLQQYAADCFVLDAQFATEQELEWRRGHQRNVAESSFGRLLSKIGLRRYAELLPTGENCKKIRVDIRCVAV